MGGTEAQPIGFCFNISQIPPARPEALKTVGRSKRLNRCTLHIIHADTRPYYVTPAGFKAGSSALLSIIQENTWIPAQKHRRNDDI
jgi:hypothetical protein